MAELAVERAGGNSALRGYLMNSVGNAHSSAGDLGTALSYFRRAVEYYEAALGPRSAAYATAVQHVGATLRDLGRVREGLVHSGRSLDVRRTILRRDHPDMAGSLYTVAVGHLLLGHYREARDGFQGAFDIQKAEFGPDHADTIFTLMDIAVAESLLGNHGRALELFARAALRDQAERNFERAIEHDRRVRGPEGGPNSGYAMTNLGWLHNERGDHARALQECRRGLALLSKKLGEKSNSLIWTVSCIGEALVGLGRADEARAELERALDRFSEQDTAPESFATIRFHLGRALWSTPASRERARELASAALASLRSAEGDHRAVMARISAWLDSHPAPTR
jgi:tetratricopeptide (TPR) repeat protein